ncbi:Nickel transporter NicT [Nocardia seriolae]|uniref:Nickel/cobalt efflux system n=1 Tax=Nocardia seriolae TaxID=37332 RepID=A0ABC9Z0F8_9NOCA|nr:HoxN/HupN/NixA family nickel/cobalt transporter [Nocardia seriolae]APA94921.1 High-affinity nickel transport protein [Nocardia seriolae]OJF83610.1 nickel transporter [Nocardia seriolae]PSK30272.1 HoxN/HupN/NixA family nickel/cobalt transporter [Nocardia seriolae]QOW37600.1 HoxN/HupN/NixA family nickel/cobalt transporter [Nocardia seriolae]QUN20012.1 HoxN/HupN/NixA family nickel/cobalt transporter [Nocardia seriolae]
MGLAVLALHILGWGTLLLFVVPGHHVVQGSVFGVGLGITAYTLGMRHAFDADHIAAIDNTTRKLVAENGRARSHTVGFWFALGHSSIVFVMVALLAFGVRALAGSLENQGSGLHEWTGLWGTTVSGSFLIAIGLLNLVSLIGIWRVYRRMRGGDLDEAALERALAERGLLNRFLGPVMRLVRKPWQMYPVGLLFGLGFDTVTEVGLLVIAGGAAATGLPWYAILVLPLLFSAGMALFDSLDGAFMSHAYDWAFARPVRKIYYHLVITGLSVAVALLIGVQEIVSIFVEKLEITSGFVAWIGNLDLGALGYIIVGLFALTWAAALAVWRFTDIETRWERDLAAD